MSWNIAVEGQAISELPEAERWAEIIEAPQYEMKPGLSDPSKTKEKLLLKVKLANGNEADYYPNQTSARFIANRLATDLTLEKMKIWISHKIVWGKILDQMVAGQQKKVLYITEVT